MVSRMVHIELSKTFTTWRMWLDGQVLRAKKILGKESRSKGEKLPTASPQDPSEIERTPHLHDVLHHNLFTEGGRAQGTAEKRKATSRDGDI